MLDGIKVGIRDCDVALGISVIWFVGDCVLGFVLGVLLNGSTEGKFNGIALGKDVGVSG